jgi:hypothetical protein
MPDLWSPAAVGTCENAEPTPQQSSRADYATYMTISLTPALMGDPFKSSGKNGLEKNRPDNAFFYLHPALMAEPFPAASSSNMRDTPGRRPALRPP